MIATSLFIVLAVAYIAAGYDYYVYTPIEDVDITYPAFGQIFFAGCDYTVTCTTSTDIDCHREGGDIVYDDDPVTHTWSGPGTFSGTGTSVTWTTPTAAGRATIHVTADDSPLANDTPQYDTVGVFVSNIIYVDEDATAGNDDGTTWANAFLKLQDALDAADSNCLEIWVAEGTYYPDEGESVTDNDRSETFQLIDGVETYGGFAGTETARSQRNWVNNETVLNGDINKDGVLDSDNSYHVVEGADNATIDGFSITAGYADSSVGGSPYRHGGGMYIDDCSPEVTNCKLIGNYGLTGGGMCIRYFACPTLTNCIFENNRAKWAGGGIYNDNYSEIEVINCLFYKNTAYGTATMGSDGGAIDTECPITITNSTFVGNVSASGCSGWSGAIAFDGVFETEDHTLSNCILWGNYASDLASETNIGYVNSVSIRACNIEGGIDGPKVRDYSNNIVDDGLNINSNPTFANSIEFSDATVDEGTGTTIKVDDASMYEVDDVIEYNGDGVGRKITDVNTTTDVITFANDAIGSNSLPYRSILNWGQNATDLTFDLQIVSGSPCIDAADGDVASTTDIFGNSRYDDPNTTNTGEGDPDYVDMGAYENQGS